MTQLQRIEFAQAAMACKRLGLLSHTTPTSVTGEKSKCVPGRIRHHFKDGILCQYCGVTKGGKLPPQQINRLSDLI